MGRSRCRGFAIGRLKLDRCCYFFSSTQVILSNRTSLTLRLKHYSASTNHSSIEVGSRQAKVADHNFRVVLQAVVEQVFGLSEGREKELRNVWLV